MTAEFDNFIQSLLDTLLTEAFTSFTGNTGVDSGMKKDLSRGSMIENNFSALLTKNGTRFRIATEKEEKEDHIDFVVYLGKGVEKTFEVKPQSRDGTFYAIELVGRTGMPGAIYGKSDYIAFHNPSRNLFYIVETARLKSIVEKTGKVKVIDRWGNLSTDDFTVVSSIEQANLENKTFYYRKGSSGGNDPSLLTTLTVPQMSSIKSFVLK